MHVPCNICIFGFGFLLGCNSDMFQAVVWRQGNVWIDDAMIKELFIIYENESIVSIVC